jgi:microcystin-dependent protein
MEGRTVKTKLLVAAGALIAAAAIYCVVPPPRQAAAQFADQSTAGGTSTGSANAQAITIGNYTANLQLVPLRFIPGFTNTGPATISVSGLPPVAILRPSSIGLVALSGQELLVGEPTSVVYNGANYVLASNVDMTPIGRTVEYRGNATPRGVLIEDGSCVSQTTYAALFSVIGTGFGSCSAGFFAVPDSRGTGFMALDGQGANGLAGRITTASCSGPNANGTLCGSQTHLLLLAEIPAHSHANTLTDPGHSHTFTFQFENSATGPNIFNTVAGGASGTTSTSSATTGITITNANAGGGGAHSVLNPVLLGSRAIKY